MSMRRLFGQAKVHWRPKQNEFFPDTTGPGSLLNVDFMEKDSKRFADSGGWGYAVFDYDSASDTSKPGTMSVRRRNGMTPHLMTPFGYATVRRTCRAPLGSSASASGARSRARGPAA
jgi:Cytochrome P460